MQIHGLSIFDADGSLYQDVPGDILLQVSLAVVSGTITLSDDSIDTVSFVTGDGMNDPAIVFVGSLQAVNDALLSLVFTPSTNSNHNFVNEFLTIVVKDRIAGQESFDGFSHTVVVPLDAIPANDAPSVVTPKIHNMKLLGFDVASLELATSGTMKVTIMVGNQLSRIVLDESGSAVVIENAGDEFRSTDLKLEETLDDISQAINGMQSTHRGYLCRPRKCYVRPPL